ncbi:MAG: lysylphosphatidylglycerol synthase transmembrane domain-containing protein [Chloroflexota bacterium]
MKLEGEIAAPAPRSWVSRYAPLLQLAFQVGFAAALLALLLWEVDVGNVRDQLSGADYWWLPLAFAANLFSDYFRAIRWREFFRPIKQVGVMFLWAVAILGVACNLALPLRAGEFVRLQVLRKRTGLDVAQVVATILSEKLMDIVAFSVFLILGIILFADARYLWPLAVLYIFVLIGGIFGARWLAHRSDSEHVRADGKIKGWLSEQAHSVGKGLQAFRDRKSLGIVSAASLAALGIDLNPAVYLLVVVAATVAVSLPFTQAGLGVFEVAITGLMVSFGVDKSQAAAFALVAHVMEAMPYLLTGPLTAIALRVTPKDIFFTFNREAEAVEAVL